jgi:hypothetical protein
MRLLVALLASAVAGAALSGCTGPCQPLLDVRNCLPEQPGCQPSPDDPEVQWNASLAPLFPEVHDLLAKTPRGGHEHAKWSEEEAAPFWQFVGVPPEREDKQVFVHWEGGLYRVRVLSC